MVVFSRSRLSRHCRGERGQTLTEFALVMPLVLILLLGIVEFGRYYHMRLTLRHGVREATRFAITGRELTDGDTGNPLSRVESIRSVILQQSRGVAIDLDRIAIDPADGGGPEDMVRIAVTYRYNVITPVFQKLLPGGGVEFTVATVMRNEPFQ